MQCIGDTCPVCGDAYAKAEFVGAGRDRVRFWHADMVTRDVYCLSFMDGEQKELVESPTPR